MRKQNIDNAAKIFETMNQRLRSNSKKCGIDFETTHHCGVGDFGTKPANTPKAIW
jgi:hypothetical protein